MAASALLAPGRELGRFRVTEELGRGSWAVVYGVQDTATGEALALKWMLDAVDVAELKHEFRIARALSHPHLVRLHEMHQDLEGVYFTMERVRGVDLVARCRREEEPGARVELVRRLFGQLAEALQCLHGAAVVHRDIKPANVLVEEPDRVVLVDFGLARPVSGARAQGCSGTLAYAAPERFRGRPASPSSDWFAFGVLMFQALVGELPFGRDPRDTEDAWMMGLRVRDPGERLGPAARGLAPLLAALLEPSPERRAGAAQVLAALGRPHRRVGAQRIVGHEARREWLTARLLAGPSRLAAVTGESGAGKTTLVRAVLAALNDRLLVLSARCHPRENIRFNALDGAVLELLAELRRADRGLAEGAPRLAGLDEDRELLANVFERAGPPRPGTTLAMVGSALLRTLSAAASGRRVLLWIDDVQWADRDSLPILEQLLADPSLELACLVVARGGVEDIPAPLRPPAAAVLNLDPLDPAASRALLAELAPTLSEARMLELIRLGDGRPVTLEQAASWALDEPDGAMPASFPELVLRLTQRRSRAHRELLATLAVHQHGLDSDVLLASKDATLSPAYDLLDAGLVEFERAAGRYRLRLRHDQIGEAILRTLSAEQRREHHARLAGAFERARPEDADAQFLHLVGAELIERARAAALRSARSFGEGLAFHRAGERYRWLIAHCEGPERLPPLQRELAAVLSHGGEALEAGETYLALISTAAREEQPRLRRAAAEQFLRAGDLDRGRGLLERCMREAGMAIPTHRIVQIGALLYHRLRIRGLAPWALKRRRPVPAASEPIEVAWSAGLGLNLIDVVSSALAQAQFTESALRHGDADQVARAVAVEYSFAMNAGGPLSARRGERLRRDMQRLLGEVTRPYTRAMVDLSWAAGDFFRGRLTEVGARITSARRGFAVALGPQSWELANCGLYEVWCALELGELGRVAAEVPELLRLGTARGDRLYRQCFVRGYCATAWLINDRADELEALLDDLPAPGGRFQMPHFFELVARQRLDLYRGRHEAAWRRIAGLWPSLASSGFLQLRWFRLALGVLLVQAALGVRDLPIARKLATKWIARIAGLDHPVASAWSVALDACLRAPAWPRRRTLEALAVAEEGFTSAGFRLAALAVRHQRALLGAPVEVVWPPVVRRPEQLARAVGLPPPSLIRGR